MITIVILAHDGDDNMSNDNKRNEDANNYYEKNRYNNNGKFIDVINNINQDDKNCSNSAVAK